MTIIYLLGYLAGILLTLVSLHKTNGFWGEWNNYDGPKDYSNYDDYISNAQAYLSFSIAWPIFIPVNILKFLWDGLLKFSEYLGKKI
jgi:hypothetical protein